jgi:hypothetical protein
MVVLFFSEVIYWRTPRFEDHIVVDKSLADRDFDVDVDVFFHALACKSVRVISEDMKGSVYDESRLRLKLTPSTNVDSPGCSVSGSISVKGLPGVISVAPARPMMAQNGEQLWQLAPDVLSSFNASHTFKRIAFGPHFPGQVCPLDGVSSAVTEKVAAYTYHTRVVPTIYEPLSGRAISSRQYSTSDFVQEIDAPAVGHGHSHAAPGLWIRYEFSPALVRRVEVRRSFLQFLTSLCAILGGAFAIGTVVDTVVWRVSEANKIK